MPRTILVVDDDPGIREGLLRLLRAHGYQAIGAKDGVEAQQKALEAHPALILMDLVMPGQNGIEVTRNLRGNPLLANIPVIALSGSIMDHGDAESVFQKTLAKPCSSSDLVGAIEALVER